MSHEIMVVKVANAIRDYDEEMETIGGCSDGYCLIKEPKGMHTNGGCRCLTNQHVARRAMMAAKRLRKALDEFA